MSAWQPSDDVLVNDHQQLMSLLARDRRMLDSEGFAFWEWRVKDNSYRVGGGFWKKLGYTELDKIVISVEGIQEFIHPDDYIYVKNTFLKHVRSEAPIDMVYRIKAQAGDYCWTQVYGNAARDEEGYVTHLSGINVDLSHLKETEKALRLSEARHERILAASNDGIWEWSAEDGEEGSFHSSHSTWRHLGYSEEEVDALPENERLSIWRSHMHPHDLVRLKIALKRHFTHKTPFDMEYRMFGHKGKLSWIRSRGQAIFNTKDRAILMSGINIDVTELKEAEARVNRAKDGAEKANKAKSDFLSSMSHELRTPLNAILGFSQLFMHDDMLNTEQRHNAQQIYSAGGLLLQLINDVLDLAQVEAGRMVLSLEPVLPHRVVDECFDMVKSLAVKRSIQLSYDVKNNQNTYVYADATRLKQCLLNLVTNAVKYNEDGGQVAVIFDQVEGDLEISVADSGPGIPESKRSELFQPFNRLGLEQSEVEGSGIGLVITKELVEKMGGTITYCDQTAKGACFKVRLPIANVEVSEKVAPIDLHKVDPVAELSFVDTKTVIYVEDNPSNTLLMTEFLKPYQQINLLNYPDAFLGLYHSRTQLPDLIILDIDLPGMSGLELVQLLKADEVTKNIPVVALSANAMPYDIEQGLACGFDKYLAKPLELNQLLFTLNQFLASAAA